MIFKPSICLLTSILIQMMLSYHLVENKDAPNELRVIALGDFGYTTENGPDLNQAKVGKFVFSQVTTADYDFIVALGDNFYPNGLESPMDRKADILLEDTFQMSKMGLDWYGILGTLVFMA